MEPSRLGRVAILVRPATLLRFHQALVKRKYQLLFGVKKQKKPGPKGPSADVVKVVLDIKAENPSYGYLRIADIMCGTFGIKIDKGSVRRILKKHGYTDPNPGNGPSWLSFIGHSKDSLYSIDLFRCESILPQSFWVLIVMDQFSRQIVGFSCNCGSVTGERFREMFVEVIGTNGWPKYISHDIDPLFRSQPWESLIGVEKVFGKLEDEIWSVPYTPTSHPFVERLIGSVRRESLDQTLFFNKTDLERKLTTYQDYYNNARTHRALSRQSPSKWNGLKPEPRAEVSNFKYESYCRGLYQVPIAA